MARMGVPSTMAVNLTAKEWLVLSMLYGFEGAHLCAWIFCIPTFVSRSQFALKQRQMNEIY